VGPRIGLDDLENRFFHVPLPGLNNYTRIYTYLNHYLKKWKSNYNNSALVLNEEIHSIKLGRRETCCLISSILAGYEEPDFYSSQFLVLVWPREDPCSYGYITTPTIVHITC
jgi:hypothetical protein